MERNASLMTKVATVLRRLPAADRREALKAKLKQTQRLALEAFMIEERPACNKDFVHDDQHCVLRAHEELVYRQQ